VTEHNMPATHTVAAYR